MQGDQGLLEGEEHTAVWPGPMLVPQPNAAPSNGSEIVMPWIVSGPVLVMRKVYVTVSYAS